MNVKNEEQDKRIDKICGHVEKMNSEFGEFKISNTAEHMEMKTNVDWLKRHYYIVVGASVMGVVAAFFNLLK